MKVRILVCICLLFSMGMNAQDQLAVLSSVETKVEMPSEKLVWDQMVYDFGKIEQNKPVSGSFEFVNRSNKTVTILSAKGGCGCTGTEFTQEPILPGGKASIVATYNAKSVGAFNKSVTVTTSLGEDPIRLSIRGTVIQ